MWFRAFVEQSEELIIKGWLTKVDLFRPSEHDLEELYTSGKQFFHLLVDKHIPLKEHPYYSIIPHICRYHAEKGTPVEDILHSSHLWRESLSELIWTYVEENKISITALWEALPLLHKRIDEVQRMVSRHYSEFAQIVIQQKQKEIDQLHDDRLSMLGKMAASMAHEIRNPLSAIEGFIKLIKDEALSQPVQTHTKINEYIGVIEKEFEGLFRQITSFLSFSKNDGTEELYEELSMWDVIHPILELTNPRAINENVEIIKHIETDFNIFVQKMAIQQVLSNLINNSIEALSTCKHEKKIIVRSWEDLNQYYISVIDNGPGIPIHLQSTIFEPFVTNKKNGTGLGLAICKQLMVKNNGDLTFTSREGETVFTISIAKTNNLLAI